MPDKPAHGSLLDRLRRQSDAIRSQSSPAKPVEEVLADMDRRLWRAYRWIEEALAHLEVIKPVVAHEFRLDSLPVMTGLAFDRGFVSYRRRHLGGQDLIEYVEMFYRLVGASNVTLKVPPASATAVEERLRHAAITFQSHAVHDDKRIVVESTFVYTPMISASVRFDPDYRRQRIDVRLSNVDRVESVNLEFMPEKFDEPALEDLLRFVLGESNAFLRRAPLAGVGPNRRGPSLKEPEVYRIEKTQRTR
jgi:hypothetical protein